MFFDAAEARENLELLVNWCDLCLPANEQAFAEAHRIKIQDFQVRFQCDPLLDSTIFQTRLRQPNKNTERLVLLAVRTTNAYFTLRVYKDSARQVNELLGRLVFVLF